MKIVTLETVRLDIPKADLKILKELAKRMGWTLFQIGYTTKFKCSFKKVSPKDSQI